MDFKHPRSAGTESSGMSGYNGGSWSGVSAVGP